MALVNYGASDDSDTSDAEDGKITTNRSDGSRNLMSGHISDEDDFDTVSSSSVTSTTTSARRAVNATDDSRLNQPKSRNTDDNVNSTSVSSLEDLPAPLSKTSNTDIEVEEEDLEDEVKPKASEIASAPKPPTKKTRQPVKITIPSLQEIPEDKDEESKKKPAPSTVKSGLFSVLPAPVHSTKKEINRPLIPHTLTKKPAPAKITKASNLAPSTSKGPSEAASTSDISSKRMTPFNALTGYDSDSDEEDENKGSTTNFFSLDSSSEVKKATGSSSTATSQRLQSEEVSSSENESNSHPKITSNLKDDEGDNVNTEKEKEDDEEEEEIVTGPEPGALNDSPLDFRSVNRLSGWSGSSYGFLAPVGPAGPVLPNQAFSSYQSSYSVPSNSMYNLADAEVSDEMGNTEHGAVADDDLKQFMSDKEFQKLQGKRKRGLEEAINFVDANVDDYVDPSEVSKHLTEETEYVSHKNKDNLPTAQQRRKKQITYLAYQAKERELELKNSWAQNRMTKKQTQSKYGF